MMKETDYKYRNDLLSSEELREACEKVNMASDEALEEVMREVWMNEEFDTSGVEEASLQRMKARIDARIDQSDNLQVAAPVRRFSLAKVLRIAAAVLLPLLMLTTWYFYQESRVAEAEQIVVSTGKGEKAHITLPDGTSVSLNADSKLSYVPHLYNKEERHISFSGEAYFKVAKDKERPFRIDGDGLEVEVLGTAFNLRVRPGKPTSELYLAEGSVRLTSGKTAEEVVLAPKHRAIINCSNGHITVVGEEDADAATAWLRNEMVFKDAAFPRIVEQLEEVYGVHIDYRGSKTPEDLFTGTLFTTDLMESLKILEKTYNLNVDIQGKEIVLSQQ